jgi:hypothetical protein
MFIFVDPQRRAIACVVLDHVNGSKTRYLTTFEEVTHLIPQKEEDKDNSQSDRRTDSLNATKKLLGVRLMWVHHTHRRQGIMQSLLDVARMNFDFGKFFDRSEVAFSQPTQQGFDFALQFGNVHRALCYSCS